MKKIIFLLVVFFSTIFYVFPQNIKNIEIQKMVDLCIKLNGIENPDLIKPGQLLMWQFPDNERFKFYQYVESGQSLWRYSKYLLVITTKEIPKEILEPPSQAEILDLEHVAPISEVVFGGLDNETIRENNRIIIRRMFFIIISIIIIALSINQLSYKFEK